MICEECKKCDNYRVCENGCFGSTEPCEYLRISTDEDYKPAFRKETEHWKLNMVSGNIFPESRCVYDKYYLCSTHGNTRSN